MAARYRITIEIRGRMIPAWESFRIAEGRQWVSDAKVGTIIVESALLAWMQSQEKTKAKEKARG
jgi:hypothetical protein